MIVVTGAAGFIGSNIVKTLNDRGVHNVLAVDDLKNGVKFRNLVDCEIMDFMDKRDFIARITQQQDFQEPIQAIFHEGACSSTTEWDGQFIMDNNYNYSKSLLHYCLPRNIAYFYASSASVYGGGKIFSVDRQYEAPLNMYGYSKFLFDQYVRRVCRNSDSQVVGFRYFNVYGPKEQHKGSMSSVAYHFNTQLTQGTQVQLFEGVDGYGHGEQQRDFIYIADVVDVNLWFLDHPDQSGIFNVGTGRCQSFNDVANAVIAYHGKGEIHYIPFPEHLKGCYQSYTQADIKSLRDAGYDKPFHDVASGVKQYMQWLNEQ